MTRSHLIEKRSLIAIISILTISVFSLTINPISAHEIRDVQTIEVDATPQLRSSKWKTIPVEIDQTSTIVSLGNQNYFTTQHLVYGYFNFSNLQPNNNDLEAYETTFHVKIYSDALDFDLSGDPTELGTVSKKLSNSAMKEGELDIIYSISELDGISWTPYSKATAIKDYFRSSNSKDKFNFTIAFSIEFKRSTNQNLTFDMFYQINIYKSLDIPPDNFHSNQNMNTTFIPKSFEIDGSSVIGVTKTVYLFLPDELIPRYFKSTNDHELNLSTIPLTINLKLELSNSDNELLRGFTIEYGGIHGLLSAKDEKSEEFKLLIELKDTTLLPITIKVINFVGQINIKATLEMKSLWADTGIYAKNEYYLSPNTFLVILAITGTIFTYKLVNYVEYRIFQNKLAQKNFSLVEEEFIK